MANVTVTTAAVGDSKPLVLDESQQQKLTNWANEPTLLDLKKDLQSAKTSHDEQIQKIKHWNDLREIKGKARPKSQDGRSKVQPRLVRRQAEWRYSAISEPFQSSPKLFNIKPTTFEDAEAAHQNEMLLNYQFRTKINRNKFIDEYVRSGVNEGTVIVRLGWTRSVETERKMVPVWQYQSITTEDEKALFDQAVQLKASDPRTFEETVNESFKAAVEFFEEQGTPAVAVKVASEETLAEKITANHPTVEVMNIENVFVDPSCEGDINKAMFVVISFETSKAALLKEQVKYKNLERINFSSHSVLSEPDHMTRTPDEQVHDAIRKKVIAYEYWGFYDIHNTGRLEPVVITWIGDTIIRMDISPFPDKKLPFVCVPYLPIVGSIYGEPDAELLEDNQNILGAVMRGMIDLLGRSANGQQGFAKGMLDPLNKRRFEKGEDYEFNPNMAPSVGYIMHTYPEIPGSALNMVGLQNQDAEALSGIKSFSGGLSGKAYGDVAAGIKGVLDAAGSREMDILRRFAKGVRDIGMKIVSMNGKFLSDKEVVRITNNEFVQIYRDDLEGNFDLEVDINTAEVDNTQAQDLGFMLQTIGPNIEPSMTQMILAKIADLKRMPDLAESLRTFKPEPDPMVEELKKLELQKAQLEIEKLQSEVDYNKARAKKAIADATQTNVETEDQVSGLEHERNLERQRAQSQGNQNLQITKALTTPRKLDTTEPDVEAAVGFNELSNGNRNVSDVAEPVAPTPLPTSLPSPMPPAMTDADGNPLVPIPADGMGEDPGDSLNPYEELPVE